MKLVSLLTLVLITSLHVGAEQRKPFYECWGELNTLLEQRPNDLDIQALHALKNGFSEKVRVGEMTEERADEIYSYGRKSLINKQLTMNNQES